MQIQGPSGPTQDDIDVIKIFGLVIALISAVVGIFNFIYARWGERAKSLETISELGGRVTALENDFKLFVTETIPDIRRERDRQVEEVIKETNRRFSDLEFNTRQIPEMATKIDLFWGFVRENFPKMLLHHGELLRDALLMKLSSNTITHDEAIDLKAILENEFEHFDDKKCTEALINRLTLLSLEAVLKEKRK